MKYSKLFSIKMLRFSYYDFVRLIEKECQQEPTLGWRKIEVSWTDEAEDKIIIQNESQLGHAVVLNNENGNNVFHVVVRALIVDNLSQITPPVSTDSQFPDGTVHHST